MFTVNQVSFWHTKQDVDEQRTDEDSRRNNTSDLSGRQVLDGHHFCGTSYRQMSEYDDALEIGEIGEILVRSLRCLKPPHVLRPHELDTYTIITILIISRHMPNLHASALYGCIRATLTTRAEKPLGSS